MELLQTNSEALPRKQGDAMVAALAPAPFWPMKGGNVNRTGYLPEVAVADLSEPSWSWEEPNRESKGLTVPNMKVFHSTPMIDGDLNVYIQSTTGYVYSLTPAGELRWEFDTGAANPGNLALLDGAVFVITSDGSAYSIDAATGAQLWGHKIAESAPSDTFSAAATEGFVIFPATQETMGGASTDIVAVRPSDGGILWRYSQGSPRILPHWDEAGYNQMPAVVDNSVLFTSVNGGAYRVGLQDGKEMWHTPGVDGASTTTAGGLVVGPNEKAYVALNPRDGEGMLRVFSLATGEVLANKTFEHTVNAGPAVGPLRPGGPLAVFVAVGDNVACAPLGQHAVTARIVALDADTLAQLWEFVLPVGDGVTAGITLLDSCCPDVFGNPTVDADGTVYINWSGGWAYAVRDANGDGTVDIDDSAEVTAFHHGGGTNGNTGLAPGMAVVPSCWKILGYKSSD